jgi:hypothetical protein
LINIQFNNLFYAKELGLAQMCAHQPVFAHGGAHLIL